MQSPIVLNQDIQLSITEITQIYFSFDRMLRSNKILYRCSKSILL